MAFFVFDLTPNRPWVKIPPLALFVVEREHQELLLVRLVGYDLGDTVANADDLYHHNGRVVTEGAETKLSGQGAIPQVFPTYLSRRDFLETIGALCLGVVPQPMPIPAFVAGVLPAAQADLNQARAIAAGSPLYHQIEDELAQKGFRFDLDSGRLLRRAEHSELVGLALESVLSAPRQEWVALALTIDRTSLRVMAAHYTRGQTLSRRLRIHAVTCAADRRCEKQQTLSMKRTRKHRPAASGDAPIGDTGPVVWSEYDPITYAGAAEWRVCGDWICPLFRLHCVRYQESCTTHGRQLDGSVSVIATWYNDEYRYL